MDISVIVCTYNRAASLDRLLSSMIKLDAPGTNRWELIVVDNNGNDNTKAIVEHYSDVLPIRYLFEGRQGKSHALNTALENAVGDLIVYTDDDVTVTPTWLSRYAQAARNNAHCSWFGGTILPVWPNGEPRWFRISDNRSFFRGYFVWYEISDTPREYTDDDVLPWGASMATRKHPILLRPGFRVDVGPTGTERSKGEGEDTDMIHRLRQAGQRGFYAQDAVCHHHLDPIRLRILSFFRYGIARGTNRVHSTPLSRTDSVVRAIGHIVNGLFQLCKFRGDNFRIGLINAGHEIGRARSIKDNNDR